MAYIVTFEVLRAKFAAMIRLTKKSAVDFFAQLTK
jgi:hypothetical protein